ncbi:MAG: succinate dehydrogenase assembly factor 2 [Gammaproteobacteria bacterium]
MSEISRLRWQCRRGAKELDLVLEEYLRDVYPGAPAAAQRAFAALLDLPDPVLLAYLMGHEQPADPEQLRVVESLQRAPGN